MNAAWMVYASCVGIMLALAGRALEQTLRQRAGKARGIWLLFLFAALIWPAGVALFGPVTVTGTVRVSQPASAMPLPAPPLRGAEPAAVLAIPDLVSAVPIVNITAARVATFAPLIGLLVLALEVIRLARARRRWRPAVLDDVPVLISMNFGPAIVGVMHPQIVIPEWAAVLPPEQRALMLAHETEHLAAHDSRWLGLAYLTVLIAPWNVGLWWLLRRVRLAVEVDCDHRVLQRGSDLELYGNLLIGIGRHDSGSSLLVAGFAERRSMLRARIERMTSYQSASVARHASRIALGAALILGACVLGPSRDGSGASSSIPLLDAGVGDSIVPGGNRLVAIKAAHALPAEFLVTTTVTQTIPQVGARCPVTLLDHRDNTMLKREGEQQFFGINPRGKVISVVGYYSVHPAGRYGVDSTQWLRVGCDLPGPVSMTGDRDDKEVDYVHALIPSDVQEMLNHLPPPSDGKPHITSKFVPEGGFRATGVGLVTATWFPRPLREQLRRLPVVTSPKVTGASTVPVQQLPVWAATKNVDGVVFDLYVSWQRIDTAGSRRIEASPAILSYQDPAASFGAMLSPGPRTTVQSVPQVLVVRP